MENFNFVLWLGALVLLIFSNSIGGILMSIVTKKFDNTKFKLGLVKNLGSVLILTSFYTAGLLLPNMQFTFQDQTLTLQGMLSVVMFAALSFFAVKSAKQAVKFLGITVPTKKDLEEDNPSLQ